MKNSKITIIVVHRGNQGYLRDALRCARQAGNEVVLIGDESNSKDVHWVDHRTCQSERYEQFVKLYQHRSTNPYKFELICFERYFLTYAYMKQHGLTECVMMDSDVCLFEQVTDELFGNAGLAVSIPEQRSEHSLSASAHFSYWTMDAMEKMIDFLIVSYETVPEPVLEKWKWHQATGTPGGICDMTLLYLFARQYDGKLVNTDEKLEPRLFDQTMSDAKNHGIEFVTMNNGVTKAVFKNTEGALCYQAAEGKLFPVLYIHAQGGDKRYIYPLSRGKVSALWMTFGNVRYWSRRIYEKLLRSIGVEKRFNWK